MAVTWLRIDDKYPRHRKIRALSDAAFRMHTTAMAHCAEEENDGDFARADLDVFVSVARGRKREAVISELEAAGLWEPLPDGWRIHDFLEWNPCKSDLEKKRAARAASGSLGGRRSGEARRQANASANGEAEAKQLLRPRVSPVPSRPVPEDLIQPETPVQDLSGIPREAPDRPPGDAFVECPRDLDLTPDQFANVRIGMNLSEECIRAIRTKYVNKARSGTKRLTVEQWRNGLNTAVCQDGPAQQRRLKPPGFAAHEANKAAEKLDAMTPRERRALAQAEARFQAEQRAGGMK